MMKPARSYIREAIADLDRDCVREIDDLNQQYQEGLISQGQRADKLLLTLNEYFYTRARLLGDLNYDDLMYPSKL